jgi:predicted dehydrogenase
VNPFRIAVIGVGYLGRHHARILADTQGVSLVAVADANSSRAREIAEKCGTDAVSDPSALLDLGLDAVTIATPTTTHHAIAKPFLQRGIAVLVEKPITQTLDDADDLIAVAAKHSVPLAVGHTERFNPAVTTALPLVSSPGFVEVHRLGTFPERSLDIDVVFDLMIHDLDVLLATVASEVVGVEAVGVPVLTDRVDIANARLRFASGCIANVTASRISRDRVRKVRFFQRDAYVSIDYSSQEVECFGLERQAGRIPAIRGGRLPVTQQEPLRLELEDFVQSVRERKEPRVGGHDGRRALALAQRIVDHMTAATVQARPEVSA